MTTIGSMTSVSGWAYRRFHPPNISLAVVKEKVLAMDADLFAKSKGQTQNFIFEAQIYVP